MKLALLILLTTFPAFGLVIPTERAVPGQMWTNAGMGHLGGIPNVTNIFTNFTASATAAEVNAAIAACPSNQVVFLTNGSFNFTVPLEMYTSGVVLRGNGKTNTFIKVAGGSGGIYMGSPSIPNGIYPTSPYIRNWTNGYGQGTNTIWLDDAADLIVGNLLILDQLDDTNWIGQAFQEGCDYCGRTNRIQSQYVRVTAISGNQLTIDPGLHMANWSATWTPQAWFPPNQTVEMVGLEDMSITNNDVGQQYTVWFQEVQNGWVRDVNFYESMQANISTYNCTHIEMRRNGQYSISSSVKGNQTYGFTFYRCSDGLMVDNISHEITSPLIFGPQANGCVMAYNYATNTIYDPANWDIAAISAHDGHICMNLVEGNWCNKVYIDSLHGTESHMTILRNLFTGHQVGRENNTMAFSAENLCNSNNLIGNILGTDSYHTVYWLTNQNGWDTNSGAEEVIYTLGQGDSAGGLTWSTIPLLGTIIHGNYDTVTDSLNWDSGIADHTIPDSYYLAAKPTWWGDRPWPWLNPTNTSAAATSPTNFPAGYRFVYGVDPPAASEGGTPGGTANVGTLNLRSP